MSGLKSQRHYKITFQHSYNKPRNVKAVPYRCLQGMGAKPSRQPIKEEMSENRSRKLSHHDISIYQKLDFSKNSNPFRNRASGSE